MLRARTPPPPSSPAFRPRQSQNAVLRAPEHSGQAVPGKGKGLGMQKILLSLYGPETPEMSVEVFQILSGGSTVKVAKPSLLCVIRQSLEPSGTGFLPHPTPPPAATPPDSSEGVGFGWQHRGKAAVKTGRRPPKGSPELTKSDIERDALCGKTSLVATWEGGMRKLGLYEGRE